MICLIIYFVSSNVIRAFKNLKRKKLREKSRKLAHSISTFKKCLAKWNKTNRLLMKSHTIVFLR